MVLLVTFLSRAEAQPEIKYPNPAYLHWEEPCIENFGYTESILGRLRHLPDSNLCLVVPFHSEEKAKATLYGVAAAIVDPTTMSCNYIYPLELGEEMQLDILLYEFTAGDSNVRLIRQQHYVLDSGRRADVVLDIKWLNYYVGDYDSVLRYPMYEFYFDSPVDLSGDYLIGIHIDGINNYWVAMGSMFYRNYVLGVQDRACCHSAFHGIVNMHRNVLVEYSFSCGDMCRRQGSKGGSGCGTLAPSLDTVVSELGQGLLPIIKPQGYLSAIRSDVEAESVQLMPNPASGKVTVMSSSAIDKIEVYDEKGNRMLGQRELNRTISVGFDVSKWAKGAYVVLVYTPSGTTAKRLVVN